MHKLEFNLTYHIYNRGVNPCHIFQEKANYLYFLKLFHRNPQKHGLVNDFRDWAYSFYDAIVHDKPTRVRKTAVLNYYGDLPAFQEAHQRDQDEARRQQWIGEAET